MPPVKSAKKKEEQLMEEVKEIRKSNKENLVCADCPNRAPAYVCTNFATFVCTECSGVHRKFGHRVKSIAMANFTEEEVEKLRHGGNEVANAHYLARYKKGKDTFILPREGERDRMEQYLTFKYVEKKWHKEKVKSKEKKGKKSENKKDGDESDSEREEGAATPVAATPGKIPQRTTAPTSSATTTTSTSSKPVVQDLLSFDATTTTQTKSAAKSSAATATTTTTTTTTTDDDDLFASHDGDSTWKPWGEETTTTKPVTKQQDDWGDDLWNSQTTTSTTSTTTATTTTSNASTTNSAAPPKRTSQHLTSLYQSSNSTFNGTYSNPVGMDMTPLGMAPTMMSPTMMSPTMMSPTMVTPNMVAPSIGMTMPMNNNYIMPNQGGLINTWPSNTGVASTTTIPPTSTTPQANLFLGALTQVNQQQKQEEEDKKRKEQASKPTTSVTATDTKDNNDPFASLVDTLDLGLKDTSIGINSATTSTTTTPQLTKRNSGLNTFATTTSNVPLNPTYGTTTQPLFGNHPYYPPNIPMAGNQPTPMYNATPNMFMNPGPYGNPSMYGGVSYMAPMTVPNTAMYGNFPPHNVSNQPQPNLWNNSSFGTVGSTTADSDNPFR